MNITKLPFIVIVFLISILPLQSRATFILNGQGTVLDWSELGVPGETVEYTFSYNLSDFANNSLNPDWAGYNAIPYIQVTIIGSVSGQFSGIDPVSRVVVFDDSAGATFDSWTFSVQGGNVGSQVLTRYNFSGDEFDRPLPDSFAEAHDIFFPRYADPLIWTQNSSGIFLANNGTEMLMLIDLQWAISWVDPATTVIIDIKPRKKPEDVISLKTDRNLKVAIVGEEDFDALQVNPATVKFGSNEASPVRFKGQDYNRDGFPDLILTFKLNETGISCGDTEATLTGETYGEEVIEGSDNFTVEPCP